MSTIEEFLTKLQTHSDFTGQKSASIDYLNRLSGDYPVGDVLLVSRMDNDENVNKYRLGYQERKSSRVAGGWRTSGYRVASRGDEKLGLSEDQRLEAEKIAIESGAVKASDVHYRQVRNKPLLMLHIMKLNDMDDKNRTQERVPAFGISFPGGHYGTTVEVVANAVWIDLMLGDRVDMPDEEEDYDD